MTCCKFVLVNRMNESENMNIEHFLRGYIACALWSSGDGGDGYLDDDSYELSDVARAKMLEDCEDFVKHHGDDLAEYIERISYDPSQGEAEDYAGHDFWLTRNGHGAGFWDRGMGELGERLADAARAYGSVDLYAMEDGKVYQS